MKRAGFVVLLTLLISLVAAPQTKSKRTSRGRQTATMAAAVEQALKDIERQWAEAFNNRDGDALTRILDERFVFTDNEGRLLDKTQYLDAVMKAIKVEPYSMDDTTVRLFGDTGVVTGRGTLKMSIEGKDASGVFRYTDTFVKRLGQWRAIASQNTPIPTPRGAGEVTTPSGLKYTDIVVGTGDSPKSGQTVTVHYTGTFENGTKFDSSVDRGRPYPFKIGVGQVIKGWDEGVMTMKVGGKRRLIIPPSLGYGAAGAGGVIPPNATLVFEVELLGVK